ncbi:MAG: phage Gp37/Gp68 family protein [Gammaproteobacteria bacterium]
MSKIEWTERTWNPVTGCTKVSPGCKYCYAETMSKRLQAMHAPGYKSGFELELQHSRLDQPLRRKKPTMYFVNSMSDLFQQGVPYSFVDKIFDVISDAPWHTFQILTKRSGRMRDYFKNRVVPNNAWLGVSVEDKKYGVPRINDLKQIAANTRFLSIEPLLEDLGRIDISDIHWVIVGGESGHKARPMKEEWVRNVRVQCEINGVDFFFKQWGTWGQDGIKRSKKLNGRVFDGKIWDQIPVVAV